MCFGVVFSGTDKKDNGFFREVVVEVEDSSDFRPREEFDITEDISDGGESLKGFVKTIHNGILKAM